jgi:hypothetical protein
MGIGGAAVYGLALILLRGLERLAGTALHSADLYASAAVARRPWNEIEERKDLPRH